MRILIKFGVAVVAVFWCFGCGSNGLLATNALGMPNDKARPEPALRGTEVLRPTAADRTIAPVKEETVEGKIEQIDRGLRFKLRIADGSSIYFRFGAQTAIRLGGMDLEMREVHPGDRAVVTYCLEDGQHVAQVVIIVRKE